MYSTAQKVGTILDGLEVAQDLELSMPVWYHPAMIEMPKWNQKWMQCFKKKHHINTVGELLCYVNQDYPANNTGQR